MDFSLIFKDLRRSCKLNQVDFAKKLGISRSTIAQIESKNNKPSRDVILRILDLCDVSDDLRKKFNEYANSDKSVSVQDLESSVVILNERIPDFNKQTVWETYMKLVTNKKIILCQCILLKEIHSYEFNEEQKVRLRKLETAISYLSNLAFGRIKFNESIFNNVISDLQVSNELIEEFSNLVLPYYFTRIRNFNDLFHPKEYKEDDMDIVF
jgi:transcriptional regulator with XRE-family HTH domain